MKDWRHLRKGTLKVVILGGRYCGKTTMLARMRRAFNDMFCSELYEVQGFRLLISDGRASLCAAENRIYDLFGKEHLDKHFVIDEVCPSIINTYRFELHSSNVKEHITLEFVEIPAVWCENNREFVLEELSKATAIIVAIDTPSLYEEKGRYSQQNNNIDVITNMITTSICNDNSNIDNPSHKLILFAPLKCEKEIILDDGTADVKGMERVNEKVREHYRELIGGMCYGECRSRITMAILPVSTIKEIEWCGFVDDKDCSPVHSYFQFRPNLRQKVLKEKPCHEFCEQPLVYILVHAMELAKSWHREKYRPWMQYLIDPRGIPIGRLAHSFIGNKPLQEMITWLKQNRLNRSYGFELLQNPLCI